MTQYKRTRAEAMMDKRDAMKEAEANGQVADSMEVRAELVRRIQAGEITPAEGQAELARIKRNAKKAGLLTRTQAFNRG